MENLRVNNSGEIVYRFPEIDMPYYRAFVEACLGSCSPGPITVTIEEESPSSFSGYKTYYFEIKNPRDFLQMKFSDCWIDAVSFRFSKAGLGQGSFTLGGSGSNVVCRLDRCDSTEGAVEWVKELDAQATALAAKYKN